MVICLPWLRIDDVTERMEKVLGPDKGWSILVRVGINNSETEGTTAIVKKHRRLVRTLKQTRVGNVTLWQNKRTHHVTNSVVLTLFYFRSFSLCSTHNRSHALCSTHFRSFLLCFTRVRSFSHCSTRVRSFSRCSTHLS